MPETLCVLDYETRSEADIKKVGAYEYARHPSTRVLCVGWKIGTRETIRKTKAQVWFPGQLRSHELGDAFSDPHVRLIAHNAFFEQVITCFVHLQNVPISLDRWTCTASMARALALPGKLEHACAALKLPVQKDMEGHRLMLKLSKPRKPTKNNPALWHDDPEDLARLGRYCATDVDAEAELFCALPELSAFERKVWLLDQRMNWRGFRVDRPLVTKALRVLAQESSRLERATARITQGEVTSTRQRDATLNWVRDRGVSLIDLQKRTVEDLLKTHQPRNAGESSALSLLRVRQAASKSSTAKYRALELRSRTDGRIRDSLVYHAASTGRWSGAGVQPQNFPRPQGENTDLMARMIAECDPETLRMLYGEVMQLFSLSLRAMIIASPGRKLFGGDYAGIEVRVLFWFANHVKGLLALKEGHDLYCEQASVIYGKPITQAEPEKRQLGKKTVLGGGFGMGPDRFLETCEQDGMKVSLELAKRAIAGYRSLHSPVVRLWSNLEKAAIAAVRNPGKAFTLNRTKWHTAKGFLWCTLPSGRRLAYYQPHVRYRDTPWGEKSPYLCFLGVGKDGKLRLESTWGGKLTENVVQATARDLLADAKLRLEESGYQLVLSVHDEPLAEGHPEIATEEDFKAIMSDAPTWAAGLPILVEAWSGKRYG